MATKFGQALRTLRHHNGDTQAQLAKRLSLSVTAISLYENGSRLPTYETLESIADYFDVSMDYLFGRGAYSE